MRSCSINSCKTISKLTTIATRYPCFSPKADISYSRRRIRKMFRPLYWTARFENFIFFVLFLSLLPFFFSCIVSYFFLSFFIRWVVVFFPISRCENNTSLKHTVSSSLVSLLRFLPLMSVVALILAVGLKIEFAFECSHKRCSTSVCNADGTGTKEDQGLSSCAGC